MPEVAQENILQRLQEQGGKVHPCLRELLEVGANFKDMAGMLAIVRQKLGLEPSFNGGK